MTHRIQRNEIVTIKTLLDGWSRTIRVVYRQLRRDNTWQLHERDLVDRGHGVSVLLHNPQRDTVLLLRQPRVAATMNGDPVGETIEVCSGLIETHEDPQVSALREVEQETGHHLQGLTPVTRVYASPGGSLETVHLFLGEYSDDTRIGEGGGLVEEGEDIELIELSIDHALRLIAEGGIRDARTILLLQFLHIRALQSATLSAR